MLVSVLAAVCCFALTNIHPVLMLHETRSLTYVLFYKYFNIWNALSV